MVANTTDNPVTSGIDDAEGTNLSKTTWQSSSVARSVRRIDRDMPENLHQATAVRCLDPTVPTSEKAGYICSSFVLLAVQLVVVMGVVLGALYPSCAQDIDCMDGFVCNNLPRGTDA
eukprot:SAG31_NODE_15743_length_740_cov_1.396256_1_plen_116_part_10